jgi:hypothetical protein
MKNLKNIFLLFTIVIAFSSCEDVIELELENVPPQLVVEANISDQAGPYTVTLTETGDFYNPNDFPPRTGAIVIISDDLGNRETLTEVSPGTYQTASIQGTKGVNYTLEITSEGKTIMASSRIPNQINSIDSIATSFEEESIFQEEGYYVTAYIQDVPNVRNYYRYKIFVNGNVFVFNQDNEDEDEFEDDNLYLETDKFDDGQYLDDDFPQILKIGDSVTVELYQINKATFDYYRTLEDAIGTAGVAPSNPISNFGREALGNFNAYAFESLTIQVQE